VQAALEADERVETVIGTLALETVNGSALRTRHS